MIEYYRQVQEIDKNKVVINAVILDGEFEGEKALWSDEEYKYKSKDLNIWEKLESDIKNLKKAQSFDIDGCNVFCEVTNGQNHLIICGAGHISIPLIKVGKMIGFYVTVIDDRSKFTNNVLKTTDADRVICDNFMSALDSVEDNINNYYVIVTRGHKYDQDCLTKVLRRPNSYIGMIGSKLRVKKVKESVIEQGFEPEELDNIYSPIGLRIGAETPEEISISIMSEIIQVKSKGNSNSGINKELLNAILSEDDFKMKMAMVTIISRRGSAPRNVGSKMLVFEDGTFFGSIGGGCAESEVFHDALNCIRKQQCLVKDVDMTGNSYEDEGMVCGGFIKVFIDPIKM
ncbi:XdhC family protein [Metaclostridioides mangenotii]|uniref:Xanthine dehydrogenase accessory factor n=1 Tax=Metaclostridioides mangenotii TaxID=1540 RepID=A0ABS4EC33_9FIRM|nr:XdhC/CoxI family protein [Clostridioides mangenotii]MBP1855493.1 xanthine dehydrogenase accessory factor [Clostridioides mangenotii]